jgi:putative transposase
MIHFHMERPAYVWRKLNPEQREKVLNWRKENHRPWHAPPHRPNNFHTHFHISAACYEHRPHVGLSPERMESFADSLLSLFAQFGTRTVAWCLLPNHYHVLVETPNVLRLLWELGRLHGRTSYQWNGEENQRGRQVFHRATERAMRSDRHFWATINYVQHNPVHHGYVRLWTDWPWSSARDYIREVGRQRAEEIWRAYPIRSYGNGWDAAEL